MKKIGDKVIHPAFGEGEIVGFGKNNHSYKIKFNKFSSERDISVEFFERLDRALPVKEQAISERMTESQDTEKMNETDNLWLRDDVPKTGWKCVGITDLGKPIGICEMCGHQIIRYVHHMQHPNYRALKVGCVCAGKMEGDVEKAKKREQDFKNKEARRENFLKREWKVSKNQNLYSKIKDHLVVLYFDSKANKWKFAVDGKFYSETYATKEMTINAVFEVMELLQNML